jgi:hypothetical protein
LFTGLTQAPTYRAFAWEFDHKPCLSMNYAGAVGDADLGFSTLESSFGKLRFGELLTERRLPMKWSMPMGWLRGRTQ